MPGVPRRPRAEPRRHLQTLPLWCPVGAGGRLPALPLWCPAGGLPALPPAYPAFGLLSCPHPPSPLPGGKGENQSFLMQGASPLASPGLNPGGTGYLCRCGTRRGRRGGRSPACPAAVVPAGGVPALPSAYPAFGLLSCPHPPNPLPRRGRGRLIVFLCKGLRPLHPRHLTACGTCRTCQAGAQRGACPGDTGSTCQSGIRQGRAFGIASSPRNRQEAVPYEQCRQPRRGGTGGEELRRLRWSSPPGQG